MKPPAIIFVIGFHRSGSSMATGMFHHLGYNVGPEADRLPADDWNKKGYFEQRKTMELNDTVLGLMGGSWYKPPDITPLIATAKASEHNNPVFKRLLNLMFNETFIAPIVIKDPRLCLTWPLWRNAANRLMNRLGHMIDEKYERNYKVVFIRRHPLDSIQSLVNARVGGMDLDCCIKLYSIYFERIKEIKTEESLSKNMPYIMSYENTLKGFEFSLAMIERAFGLSITVEQHNAIFKFIDPKLRTIGADREKTS